MLLSDKIKNLAAEAESALSDRFSEIDRVSTIRTEQVIEAFQAERVSEAVFMPSTGYGYDDQGREKLDRIYASVFGTEAAFVRHSILSGTHALTIGLFGLLRPGDTMLAVTGKPYDTLDSVIGISGKSGEGSLHDFGINYRQIDLLQTEFPDESPAYMHKASDIIDFDSIKSALASDRNIKVIFIQRSKGYLDRPTLTVSQINEIISFVRNLSEAFVVVDNCYGEFTELSEPKADLLIGSLDQKSGRRNC